MSWEILPAFISWPLLYIYFYRYKTAHPDKVKKPEAEVTSLADITNKFYIGELFAFDVRRTQP